MRTLLTAKEVAEITGLAYTTVRRLAITPGANFPPCILVSADTPKCFAIQSNTGETKGYFSEKVQNKSLSYQEI